MADEEEEIRLQHARDSLLLVALRYQQTGDDGINGVPATQEPPSSPVDPEKISGAVGGVPETLNKMRQGAPSHFDAVRVENILDRDAPRASQTGEYEVGDSVEVLDDEGEWWRARVTHANAHVAFYKVACPAS